MGILEIFDVLLGAKNLIYFRPTRFHGLSIPWFDHTWAFSYLSWGCSVPLFLGLFGHPGDNCPPPLLLFPVILNVLPWKQYGPNVSEFEDEKVKQSLVEFWGNEVMLIAEEPNRPRMHIRNSHCHVRDKCAVETRFLLSVMLVSKCFYFCKTHTMEAACLEFWMYTLQKAVPCSK